MAGANDNTSQKDPAPKITHARPPAPSMVTTRAPDVKAPAPAETAPAKPLEPHEADPAQEPEPHLPAA